MRRPIDLSCRPIGYFNPFLVHISTIHALSCSVHAVAYTQLTAQYMQEVKAISLSIYMIAPLWHGHFGCSGRDMGVGSARHRSTLLHQLLLCLHYPIASKLPERHIYALTYKLRQHSWDSAFNH